MILGWKKKVEQVRCTVLAASPLRESDPAIINAIVTLREARKISTPDELKTLRLDITPDIVERWSSSLTWESTEIYGWMFEATLYLGPNGEPWWLLAAFNKRCRDDEVTAKHVATVANQFGAGLEDLLLGGGDGDDAIWWTWPNKSPLLEMHFNASAKIRRVVSPGTPPAAGFVRVDRNAPPEGLVILPN